MTGPEPEKKLVEVFLVEVAGQADATRVRLKELHQTYGKAQATGEEIIRSTENSWGSFAVSKMYTLMTEKEHAYFMEQAGL